MRISDLTKEHPTVDVPKSVKAKLKSEMFVTVITPSPNSDGKRQRRLQVNRYGGAPAPIVTVLSDEEV